MNSSETLEPNYALLPHLQFGALNKGSNFGRRECGIELKKKWIAVAKYINTMIIVVQLQNQSVLKIHGIFNKAYLLILMPLIICILLTMSSWYTMSPCHSHKNCPLFNKCYFIIFNPQNQRFCIFFFIL